MKRRFLGGVLAFCANIAACGSSPQSRFYALSPEQGVPRGQSVGIVEVREPSLPGYLDRAEVVTSAAQSRVRYADADRWAEPFARMLCRVLAADLRTRLPAGDVFAESSAISLTPDEFVEVAIQDFDRGSDGRVTLVAQVVVDSGKEPATATMRIVRLTDMARAGTAQSVASMNRLVGRLADTVAELLVARTDPAAAR